MLHWVLQDVLFDDPPAMSKVLDDLGMPYAWIQARRDGDQDPWPTRDDGPTLAMVSVATAARIARTRPWVPGVFWHAQDYSQRVVSAHLGAWVLNQDQIFLPWGEVKRRGAAGFQQLFGGDGVFLRPDSGQKIFTGQVVPYAAWEHALSALEQIHHLTPDVLVGLSSSKPLDPIEWRCWVVLGRVVAHSTYGWSDVAQAELPMAVKALAETAAAHWSPAPAFVIDIGFCQGSPWIIECNAASTSGTYQADLTALAKGLARAAHTAFDDVC